MNNYQPIPKHQTQAHEMKAEESDDSSLSFTSCPIEEDTLFPPDKKPCRPIPQTYDWVKDLTQNNYDVAPVQCFRYVRIVKNNLYISRTVLK